MSCGTPAFYILLFIFLLDAFCAPIEALSQNRTTNATAHKRQSNRKRNNYSSSSYSTSSSEEHRQPSSGSPSMSEYEHLFCENAEIMKKIQKLITGAKPKGALVAKDKKYMLPLRNMMLDVNRKMDKIMREMKKTIVEVKRHPYGVDGRKQTKKPRNGRYPHDHQHGYHRSNRNENTYDPYTGSLQNQSLNHLFTTGHLHYPYSPAVHDHNMTGTTNTGHTMHYDHSSVPYSYGSGNQRGHSQYPNHYTSNVHHQHY